MKITRFEDIEAWQEARKLVNLVYDAINRSDKFRKDFRLVNQLQGAAVSAMSNIAEGFSRKSNKEFIQYLHIAKGSCAELRTQMYLSIEVGIVNKTLGKDLMEKTRKISAMLYKLIQTRRKKF